MYTIVYSKESHVSEPSLAANKYRESQGFGFSKIEGGDKSRLNHLIFCGDIHYETSPKTVL